MKDMKFDSNKPRMDLIEPEFLEGIAKVLTLGASKYAPDSWKTQVSEPERRYYAAALRHLVAWKKGEKMDPESGLSHLYHAACNLMFLGFFDEAHPTENKADPVMSDIKYKGRVYSLDKCFIDCKDIPDKIRWAYIDAMAGTDLLVIEEAYDVTFVRLGDEITEARADFFRNKCTLITVIRFEGKDYTIPYSCTMPKNVIDAYCEAKRGKSVFDVEKQYGVKFKDFGRAFIVARDVIVREREDD